MTTPGTLTMRYRVTSLTEAGQGFVTVSFIEERQEQNVPGTPYGSFSRTFSSADADAFFPGQFYTMTLTLEA